MKFARDEGTGGQVRVDDLPDLCDKLGLHLLMNSEDMSFHFKFMEVVERKCEPYLDDGSGFIDLEK